MTPGERITVEGRECVVVCDAVAEYMPPADQDVALLGRHGRRFFYAAGGEVRRMQRKAPDARVVGMWHLLTVSQAVDKHGLYVVYSDGEKNGRYFFNGADAVFAGEVRAGKPTGTFGRAIDFDDAHEIELGATSLRLPEGADPARETRRRMLLDRAAMAAGVVLVLASFVGAWNYEDAQTDKRRLNDAATRALRAEVDAVKNRLMEARTLSLGEWPAQSASLDGFLFLAARDINFSARDVRLAETEATVMLGAEAAERVGLAPAPGAEIERRADGTARLRWRLHREEQ